MLVCFFQLTTSHGGRPTGPIKGRATTRPFNSRPHMEVDVCMVKIVKIKNLSTHDLTWRSTVDSSFAFRALKIFQLTTSHGGRRISMLAHCHNIILSTHDLTWRSTDCDIDFSRFYDLSTHDLTWRSTGLKPGFCNSLSLSTHDLTWRSTFKRIIN